jgi:hypothetical protein
VKKKKIQKANLPHKMDTACTGQPITRDDVFGFFDEAAGGRKTRAEVMSQTDRLLLHLERGCTPSLGNDDAVYEKLQSLTWGFLHDGPRSLRGIKLHIAALKAVKEQAGMDRGFISSQVALLEERARVLRAYGNRTALNYNGEWPPGTSDGHVGYPPKRCGGFPLSVRPVSGTPIAEDDNGELERLIIKRPSYLLHVPAWVGEAAACD